MSGRLKSSVISQGRIFNENQNLHKRKSHERKMLGATDKQKLGDTEFYIKPVTSNYPLNMTLDLL